MNEKQLLREPDIYPKDDVLAVILGNNYSAYISFVRMVKDLNIDTEWRYYNDGKSWLSKNTYKKKTVFWLSVWEGYFQLSLFFTEKTKDGVLELPVSADFKQFHSSAGKLIPLIIKVDRETNLGDLLKIIEYKRNIK